MDALLTAFHMVFEPKTMLVMLASSVFGLFVGAVPGLTATMATPAGASPAACSPRRR